MLKKKPQKTNHHKNSSINKDSQRNKQINKNCFHKQFREVWMRLSQNTFFYINWGSSFLNVNTFESSFILQISISSNESAHNVFFLNFPANGTEKDNFRSVTNPCNKTLLKVQRHCAVTFTKFCCDNDTWTFIKSTFINQYF